MKLVIVTGMSGAGKTVALKMMEDMGYYCVDNLPIPLIEKFAELALGNNQGLSNQVALGIDIRSGQELPLLDKILERWRTDGIPFEILFLDASDEVLLKRYKETRRNHPLALNRQIPEGIKIERKILNPLKEIANYIVDTTNMKPKDLKEEILKIYSIGEKHTNLTISVLSFGFKHGIPKDSDLVFDVRFLPNPYYLESLRNKTGDDQEVRDYVMNSDISKQFYAKLTDMIDFLIPQYVEEGKHHLVISIGCTGGRHRSVTITNLIAEEIQSKGYRVVKKHRDFMLK